MSQRIIGLDIGRTSVKATTIETSFRSLQLVETLERKIAVPSESKGDLKGVESPWKAALHVLRDLKNEGRLEADTVITSIPGDQAIYRFLRFPFTDRKQIESTVGFEFEGQVPFSIDDLVFDYQVVGESEEGATVLTVGAKLEEFEDLLNGLKELELEPKMIGVGALTHFNTMNWLENDEGRTLLIDLGAVRTDILLTRDGTLELARTLQSGGNQITESISQLLGISFAEAEGVKCEEALVATENESLIDPQESRLVPAVRVGLSPIMKAVKQSIERVVSDGGGKVDRVVLCGGGARLRGLREYVERILGASTSFFSVADHPLNRMNRQPVDALVMGKSLALALRASSIGDTKQVNFRKGLYSYAGDFQYLRDRAPAMVLLAVILLVVAFGRMNIRHSILTAERDSQIEALKELSRELLGKEKDDFDSVLSLLKKAPDSAEVKLFPAISAKQVFYDITTIMQQVNEASKEEIMALRGTDDNSKKDEEELENPESEKGTEKSNAAKENPSIIRPPGPSSDDVPQERLRMDRAGRLEQLRSAREQRAAGLVGGRPRAVVSPLTGSGAKGLKAPRPNALPSGFREIRAERDKAREESQPPLVVPSPTEGEEVEVKETADEAADERFIVELEAVQVDESGANLKGEANSLEAATFLEQKLGKHPCFQNVVLDGTDKISFERHRGWRSFRIELELDCIESVSSKEPKRKGGE